MFNKGLKAIGFIALLGVTLLTGCIFSEGHVSDHSFMVFTNQSMNGLDPDKVAHDVVAFAKSRGFVETPELIPELHSSKLNSFHLHLDLKKPGEGLSLGGSYTATNQAVIVSLWGEANKASQAAANQFYADFKSHYGMRYPPGAITDDLAGYARSRKQP